MPMPPLVDDVDEVLDADPRVSHLPVTGVRFHECRGLVLFLPRTGLTVVPFRLNEPGWASAGCVVIDCPPEHEEAYAVGGFNLDVSREEIERAMIRGLAPSGPVVPAPRSGE